MGREKLPCGCVEVSSMGENPHAVIVTGQDGSAAGWCTYHKKRYKWRPAAWIEIKPKLKSSQTSTAPTTI